MTHPVEEILGYHFQDAGLLKQALTHPSCNELTDGVPSHYQRLEFLGDSVLGLIVSDMLEQSFPQEAEGLLARRKASLVDGQTLARLMRS